MKKISFLQSFFSLLRPGENIAIASIFSCVAAGFLYVNFCDYQRYAATNAANDKKAKEQSMWTSRESEIDQHFQNVIDDIRRREHIDQAQLMDRVGSAAKKLSIKYHIPSVPESITGKFFSFNKISIDLQDVYFTDILNFDSAIELDNSALCVDDLKLSLSGKKLSATIGISALDIKSDENISNLVAKILESHNLSEKLIMWNDRKNLVE